MSSKWEIITLSELDSINDNFEIHVKKNSKGVKTFTDDGETLNYLYYNQIDLNDYRILNKISRIAKEFNFKILDGHIVGLYKGDVTKSDFIECAKSIQDVSIY